MAIKARVNNAVPRDEQVVGDTVVETYRVVFFGPELPAPDSSLVTVTYTDADTILTAENKIVDAVQTEANRLGYVVTRNRVAYFKLARGS